MSTDQIPSITSMITKLVYVTTLVMGILVLPMAVLMKVFGVNFPTPGILKSTVEKYRRVTNNIDD